jgi:hypothetical protein
MPDPYLQQAMRTLVESATPREFPIVNELKYKVANLAYGLSWSPGRLGPLAVASMGASTHCLTDLRAALSNAKRR